MKRLRSINPSMLLLLIVLALGLSFVATVAQDEPTDGEYTLEKQQIDSGSGEMTDGEYGVYGAAGVPYDGESMTDGDYTVEPDVMIPQPPANAYIHLTATEFVFGDNWNGVAKTPIGDMYVEVYDESCPDVAGYGAWNWKADLRADYFNAVRTNCSPAMSTGLTNVDGEVEIGVYAVPGPHIIVALYEKEIDGQPYQLYLAKRVQIDESGSTVDVKLGVMIYTSRFVAKRRVLPLAGTTVYGSELNIYEPEYIVWEVGQTQEDFPFIEESGETWTIETTLEPPEGYVPDEATKTTYVADGTETTVFQVTEVGSVMDYTKVEHDIKELKNGKVVQHVHLKHGIGTKANGESEKFGSSPGKEKQETTPAVERRPEAIKLHEVFGESQED